MFTSRPAAENQRTAAGWWKGGVEQHPRRTAEQVSAVARTAEEAVFASERCVWQAGLAAAVQKQQPGSGEAYTAQEAAFNRR
jgi:hypothetical protein